MTPAGVLLIDFQGEIVEGDGRVPGEFHIHTEILRTRPELNSVVHTHPRHAIAFAALRQPLRPVSHEGSLFGPNGVPTFEDTTDLILTPELGQGVSRSLGGAPAVFLINHGIATAGRDIATATTTAIVLESACALQLKVLGSGSFSFSFSTDEELEQKRQHIFSASQISDVWGYLVRTVGLEEG
jgi:ribulose-5-phosphate 4-epimerase/fuculose-1-phosphate aldolase